VLWWRGCSCNNNCIAAAAATRAHQQHQQQQASSAIIINNRAFSFLRGRSSAAEELVDGDSNT
jgi:hypothetical protein